MINIKKILQSNSGILNNQAVLKKLLKFQVPKKWINNSRIFRQVSEND